MKPAGRPPQSKIGASARRRRRHATYGKARLSVEEKIDGAFAVCRGEAEGSEIVGDPVRAGLDEFRVGRGGAQREDAGAGGFAGAYAGGGVFNDDAVAGGKAQKFRGFDVRLGIRLAALDVRGGNHVFRQPETSSANAHLRERASAGGGDHPTVGGKRLQKLQRAGEGNYAFHVFDFAAFDLAIFRIVIGVGKQLANGGDARPAVRLAHDFVGHEAVLRGPFCPYARDGRSGVHEHAVEVKEHATAPNFHEFHDTWYSAGQMMAGPFATQGKNEIESASDEIWRHVGGRCLVHRAGSANRGARGARKRGRGGRFRDERRYQPAGGGGESRGKRRSRGGCGAASRAYASCAGCHFEPR